MEIFALLSVVGILGLVSIPSYISYQTNCRASALADNFRLYAFAFHNYSQEKHSWPTDVRPGTPPPGLEQQLPQFREESVLGGKWDWVPASNNNKPAICLINPRNSAAVIARMDEILDDGNIETGDLVFKDQRIAFFLSQEKLPDVKQGK